MDRRARLSRWSLVVASVAVAVLAGGAVAWAAIGSDDPPTDTATTAPAAHDHGDDEDMASRGERLRHDHEPLPPYDERYDEASTDERAAADDLISEVRGTLTAYEEVDAAVAAGYRAPAHPGGPIRHYLDPAVAREGQVLDASRPNGLVYHTGGDGDPVLLGAFFIAPPGRPAPAPAGDLVVWHSHSAACPGFFATEADPCTDSRRMLHAWTVDQAEIVARRTGQPVQLEVTDPFGAPFRHAVAVAA